MKFIIKRRIKQMMLGKRNEPVVESICEPVLYASEAYEVMENYLPAKPVEWFFTLQLRIVKRKGTQDFYWVREYRGIDYAVKIGAKSKLFAVSEMMFTSYFEEITLSMTIEIPLKDCKRQTRENTLLFLSAFYDADTRALSLQTLNLRGTDIRNFPHDYWAVSTISNTSGDCDYDGCCGAVRFVKTSDFPEMDLGGLEIYDTVALWTGSKTLKVFNKYDAGCTIERMLDYWKKFWKVCGY